MTAKEWVKKWMLDHKHLKMGSKAVVRLMTEDFAYDLAKGDIDVPTVS